MASTRAASHFRARFRNVSPGARGFAQGRERLSEVDVDQGRKASMAVENWIGEGGCYHSLLPLVTSRTAGRCRWSRKRFLQHAVMAGIEQPRGTYHDRRSWAASSPASSWGA